MSKKAFDKIAAGLNEAMEIARHAPFEGPKMKGLLQEAMKAHASMLPSAHKDEETRVPASYPMAKLAFLTQPEAGVCVLNVDDGKRFRRVQLTLGQLNNMVVDGARMALRPAPNRLKGAQINEEGEAI